MSSSLQTRLNEFKTRFSNLISGRPQGYDELNTLERPLVGGDYDDDYDDSQTGGTAYRPPRVHGASHEDAAAEGVERSGGSFTNVMPTQEDELRELTVLGKDAAEILWEMVILGEATTPAAQEMRGNAEQLRAQLRGIISDYQGTDETLFAGAFEAFEMLSRSLDGDDTSAAPVSEQALAGTMTTTATTEQQQRPAEPLLDLGAAPVVTEQQPPKPAAAPLPVSIPAPPAANNNPVPQQQQASASIIDNPTPTTTAPADETPLISFD